MDGPRPGAAVGLPVPTTEATRLVVRGVRAGGQLAIALLARDPRLAVVLLGRRRPEVAGGDRDHPVGNLELGQDALLDREQTLVLLARPARLDEREHLHLVELVDAEDPARVAAGGTGLAAEAAREAGIAKRQVRRLEDLVRVQPGQRDLGGPDQEEVVLGDLVNLVAVAG